MGSGNLNTRESQKAPICSFAQPFVLCIFLGNTSLSNNISVFIITKPYKARTSIVAVMTIDVAETIR